MAPAITKLFSAGSVKWLYGATGATTAQLNGIPNLRYNSNLTEVMEACGLNIDPDFLAVLEATPAYEIDVVELNTCLSPTTIDGFNGFGWGDTGSTGNKFQAQFAQFEKFKGRYSAISTKHMLIEAKRGMAYLKSLRATRRTVARGVMRVLPLWNGTDPVVEPSQDVAGLTFSPITNLFTVGPLVVNGVEVGTVTEISYDLGEEVEYAGAGGTEWPDFVGFAGRKPEFSVTCKDVPQLIVQTIMGFAQGATDSEVYLRGVERNKKRFADNLPQHIKFTMDEGRIAVESISGGNRGSSDVTIKLMPAFDGTNQVLAIAVASPIVIP